MNSSEEIPEQEDSMPVLRSFVCEELDLPPGNQQCRCHSCELERKTKNIAESLKDLGLKDLQEVLAIKICSLEETLKTLEETLERKETTIRGLQGDLKMKAGPSGATKRKLESIENEQEEEKEIAASNRLVKKRKAGTSNLVSLEEAAKTYVETMLQHFQTDDNPPHETPQDKLAAEKALQEKWSAAVISKCERTARLSEEQKENAISGLLVPYMLCKSGTIDPSVVELLRKSALNYCYLTLKYSALYKTFPIAKMTPKSLGIKLDDGKFHQIIPKGTRIPTCKTSSFLESYESRDIKAIAVYYGNNDLAVKNMWIGEFYLTGIRPSATEREVTVVTMEVDEEGVLEVSAVCRSSGIMESIKVPALKWLLLGR